MFDVIKNRSCCSASWMNAARCCVRAALWYSPRYIPFARRWCALMIVFGVGAQHIIFHICAMALVRRHLHSLSICGVRDFLPANVVADDVYTICVNALFFGRPRAMSVCKSRDVAIWCECELIASTAIADHNQFKGAYRSGDCFFFAFV